MELTEIERAFREATGYTGDLSIFPITSKIGYATDREKAREYAEVFTPPDIVDRMLQVVPTLPVSTRYLDLCAGHGQFAIRILRKVVEENPGIDLDKFIQENLFFSELQVESCYKLLKVFGDKINLAIGDSRNLHLLPEGWRGVWVWLEEGWVNVTRFVRVLLDKTSCSFFPVDEFVRVFKGLYKIYSKNVITC